MEKDNLYPIGKISKMVGLSIDTLRYYDEIGLIVPAHISDTGYRYYKLEQAADFTRVLELKEYGFSLQEIKAIEFSEAVSLRSILQKRYFALLEEKTKLQEAIDKLAIKIKNQEEAQHMKKRVLLVDDAAFMRMMCGDIFTKSGYEIAGEADNGQAGVDQYKSLKPDLVVLNITMPVKDGISALKEIIAFDPNAKVVMLSAMGRIRFVGETLTYGAGGFIVKPFQADKLLETARQVLETEGRFNSETLRKIMNHSKYGLDDILPQTEIDKIVKLAESQNNYSDSDIRELLEKLITELPPELKDKNTQFGTATVITAPEPAESLTEQQLTLQMLKKIADGQDKMVELLSQMITRMDYKDR